MIATNERMLTPPQVARRYGVKAERVIGWIRSGELRAINVASKASRRPRFRIDPADLTVFENGRLAATAPKITRRRRRKNSDVIPFF